MWYRTQIYMQQSKTCLRQVLFFVAKLCIPICKVHALLLCLNLKYSLSLVSEWFTYAPSNHLPSKFPTKKLCIFILYTRVVTVRAYRPYWTSLWNETVHVREKENVSNTLNLNKGRLFLFTNIQNINDNTKPLSVIPCNNIIACYLFIHFSRLQSQASRTMRPPSRTARWKFFQLLFLHV